MAVKVMVMSGRPTRLNVQLLKNVEANCLRTITHPNIVQTYHIYKVQDLTLAARGSSGDEEELGELREANILTPVSEIWIVQELCNKGDLKRYCRVRNICNGIGDSCFFICALRLGFKP